MKILSLWRTKLTAHSNIDAIGGARNTVGKNGFCLGLYEGDIANFDNMSFVMGINPRFLANLVKIRNVFLVESQINIVFAHGGSQTAQQHRSASAFR